MRDAAPKRLTVSAGSGGKSPEYIGAIALCKRLRNTFQVIIDWAVVGEKSATRGDFNHPDCCPCTALNWRVSKGHLAFAEGQRIRAVLRCAVGGVSKNIGLMAAFEEAFHGRRPSQPHSQNTFELIGLDSSLRNSVVWCAHRNTVGLPTRSSSCEDGGAIRQ
jgi:hypothetical protein